MKKINKIGEVSKETLVETVIDVVKNKGEDWIKEQGLSLLAETVLDLGLSIVPALGNALTSYKTNRAIRNLDYQIQLLIQKTDAIQENLIDKSTEMKKQLDELFCYMLEKTVNEKQKEKIKYFTNAFVNLTSYSEIDIDISYIYFDTLEQLTLLDIQVLLEISKGQFYYYLNPDEEPNYSFNSTQLQAIKSNLNRLGLAENYFDKALSKDLKTTNEVLEEIRTAVIELQERWDKPKVKIHSIKNRSKTKVSKIKAKDRIIISQFGREMIEFFKEQEADK